MCLIFSYTSIPAAAYCPWDLLRHKRVPTGEEQTDGAWLEKKLVLLLFVVDAALGTMRHGVLMFI